MQDVTQKIIGVLVAVVVLVALLPMIASSITSLSGNANLSAPVKIFLGLIPLFLVIGITIGIISYTKGKR